MIKENRHPSWDININGFTLNVYVFLLQRISAGMMRSKLQFFGQTIDGKMDLGEDGLTDIVVGARGAVVVLRYESKK